MMKRQRVVYPGPENATWLYPESYCGRRNGYKRQGRALMPDGKVRAVMAKLPDTFYSVPAFVRIKGKRVKGYLTRRDGVWYFHSDAPEASP